jgi:tetratricopeptide (TPR) repeat protein
MALRRLIRWCLATALLVAGAGGVDAAPELPGKPDWPGLEALMIAGDYDAAATAADAIAKAVRPKPRDPAYLAQSLDLIRSLMRLGVARLRLGDLDAADAAFSDAFKAFKDKDFQRLLNLESRQANATVKARLVQLEVDWLHLLSLRMTVITERMRSANRARTASDAVPPDEAERLAADVARWMDQLAVLKRLSAEARESFAERLGDGGPAVGGAPLARSVTGPFSAAMTSGVTALERSRLPFETASPSGRAPSADAIAATEAGEEQSYHRVLLDEALDEFREAAVAFEETVAAATPKAGGLKPEIRIEVAVLEIELLANRGAALFEKGDVEGARKDFDRVLELERELLGLRKAPRAESHPDLFSPLLAAAEIALVEGQRRVEEGDVEGSRADLVQAEKNLAVARSLRVPESHPLQAVLARIATRLESQQRALQQSIPRSERAGMAARRLRRAIDATATSGAEF